MSTPSSVPQLYLDLLKKSLLCTLYEELDGSIDPSSRRGRISLLRALLPPQVDLVWKTDPAKRATGEDWPRMALTMVGSHRLNNVQWCIETALRDGVPGDLIETGVWRGGTCILMRGVLAAYGVTDRVIYVADSFQGVPAPDSARYPADVSESFHTHPELSITEAQVRSAFERYGLLDNQVRFLPGWFKDTLPTAPIRALAVARLDGDLYESTMDALTHLYPRLSPGGFLIVDDYGCVPACRQAVHDYRDAHGIDEPIEQIDWTGVYWRRRDSRH